MVSINTFRRDAAAMRDGEWINPGPEYGGLEIKTRALGYQYLDAVAARVKLAARKFGGEDRIPAEVRAEINIECLIDKVLLDVRGLEDGEGNPVDFATFCNLLRDPGFGELQNVAFACAGMVGRRAAAEAEEAAGNSQRPSA